MSKSSKHKFIPALRFPQFKSSGNWKENHLNEIGEFIGGGTPDTTKPAYWNGDIPWFTPTEIKKRFVSKSERTISEDGLKNSSAKVIPVGSILITTRATIGDISIALNEFTTNQGIQSFVVNKEHSNHFWYYWIERHKKEFIRRASGSTFPEISKTKIASINGLSPEKPEQQKIASCLSSLDNLITAESEKLEVLKEHKKGLLQNLFPREGESVPRVRFREFTKGNDWEKRRLEEIAELTSSKRIHLADYVLTGIPFFRGKEISQLKNNKAPDDILYISHEQYNEIREKYGVPSKGDILITAVGTLGNVYLIKNDIKFYFKDGNLIWMKNIAICSEFLEVLLDVEKEKVLASAIGSSQKALTMTALNKLEFMIPENHEEQKKIASCLSAFDRTINAQSQKLEALNLFKKGLLQGLFPEINDSI